MKDKNPVPAASATTQDERMDHELHHEEHEHHNDGLAEELEQCSLSELRDRAGQSLLLQANPSLHILNCVQAELKHRLEDEEEGSSDSAEIQQLSEEVKQWIQLALQSKEEEADRIEAEKQENYLKKCKLIEELEMLTRSDETENSIEQVKEIQRQWKDIRVLPQNKVQELWDEFHGLLDLFYDNHSINIELKELDRRKNLEAKIELTKKVEELLKESSIKTSFNLLNKYHDEFRHIGPIPQESREAIWNAFKAASDLVYTQKKEELDKINSKLKDNLKLKEAIVEKASLLAKLSYDNQKAWNQHSKEMDALFADWKSVGMVPRSKSDDIWKAFRNQRNLFYAKRKQFFNELNKDRFDNLKLKEALCAQVEELKDSNDFQGTTRTIIQLQKEWKEIGPVPEHKNQIVWKRFRSACDAFFKRKDAHLADVRKDEEANLLVKQEVIKAMSQILEKEEDPTQAFAKLKELNHRWRQAGYVPRKVLTKINSEHDQLADQIFKKFGTASHKAGGSTDWGTHYGQIAQAPNGIKQLRDQEIRLNKRLSGVQAELTTIETNLSFFAKSSNADKLLKDFEHKKEGLRSKIEQIRNELKALRQAKRSVKE